MFQYVSVLSNATRTIIIIIIIQGGLPRDIFITITIIFSHHSFIHAISIAPLQAQYYSEVLPTQHGYCAGISRLSATGGNCE